MAAVVMTPTKEGFWDRETMPTSGEGGYVMLNQFANDDNWKAHYKTTGPGNME
jgi:cysteine synthase B